jgi:hypothetical protein
MRFIAIPFAILAIVATSGQAAPTTADASLSGIPLTVAKRLNQLPTPSQARTDVMLTGVSMRTATSPAAATLPGKSPAGLGPVQLSSISMAKATRPWSGSQPAGGQVGREGCEPTHQAMLINPERSC